jgi:hypothetical protein
MPGFLGRLFVTATRTLGTGRALQRTSGLDGTLVGDLQTIWHAE